MANQGQKPKKNLSPSTSTARRNNSLSYGESCVYAGVQYSDGSIVNQDGKSMRCSNGSWVAARIVATVKGAKAKNKGTQ